MPINTHIIVRLKHSVVVFLVGGDGGRRSTLYALRPALYATYLAIQGLHSMLRCYSPAYWSPLFKFKPEFRPINPILWTRV